MHHNTFIGRIAAVATVALGLLPALAGDIIYVKSTGSNTAPYDTEETAATTLTTALTAVTAERNKIKVVGTVKQDAQITLANVEIFGDGWDTAGIQHTAGKVSPVFKINDNVVIHGLKFTIDKTGYLRDYYYLTGEHSVISNCWFSNLNCKSLQTNQEIAGHATAGLITHCLFSGIYTSNGGAKGGYGQGVLDLSGTARMANSIFTGNHNDSNLYGPCDGLLVVSGNAVLENCVIYGNYSKASSTGDNKGAAYRYRRGGGVFVYSGSPTIRNCIVRNNKKPHAYDSGESDIYSATEEGDFYIAPGATPTIENCNIPEDQVPAGAVNCQTGEPLFVNAANGDFQIKAGSPCIDAGKIVAGMSGTDYYLNPRVAGYGVDIGANEYALPTPELDIESSVTNATGRQVVDFTAVDRAAGSTLPTDWTFTWTVDGTEQASTVSTMSAMLEPGTHTIGVAVGNQSVIKTDFITIEQAQGVEFLVTPTPYAGFQLVDLKGYGSGGTEIQAGATYTWYWRKATEELFPATPCTNGNDLTEIRFDDPGAYCFKLVVLNYDGKGNSIESTHADPEVTVVSASVSVGFSETTGEGRTLIDLSATANGFTFDDDAVFEWRWATGGEMPAAAQVTGNPATGTFFPGTWTVQLIVTDADGAGTCFTNTIANAVAIADGADYYVSADGDDSRAGTKTFPYKTLAQALAQPAFGTERKTICILGTVAQNTNVTLADVELYGEGWDDSGICASSDEVNPVFSIKANVFVHGLKFTADSVYLRSVYTLSDSSSVISNCWFSNLRCNTAQVNQEIGGRVSAGLVTHCLFSGLHTSNGGESGTGVFHLSGTGRMANSVFTGCYHEQNKGGLDGLLTMSGNAVLENCVVFSNTVSASSNFDATAAYRNRNGAGICVRSGSPTIRNCIVRDNLKPHAYSPEGGDIYRPTEQGNFYIVSGATPTITNCNVPEGQIPEGATNCQTGNPKFTDPDNPELVKRDFSIAEDSPCRNAGANKLWQRAATDYTGVEPRRQGGKVDIGAYEYPDRVAPVPPMLLVR